MPASSPAGSASTILVSGRSGLGSPCGGRPWPCRMTTALNQQATCPAAAGTPPNCCNPVALFGWPPLLRPADTAVKRRVDRVLPSSGLPLIIFFAAVIARLNAGVLLPARVGLAAAGLAAATAGSWCSRRYWRTPPRALCQHRGGLAGPDRRQKACLCSAGGIGPLDTQVTRQATALLAVWVTAPPTPLRGKGQRPRGHRRHGRCSGAGTPGAGRVSRGDQLPLAGPGDTPGRCAACCPGRDQSAAAAAPSIW